MTPEEALQVLLAASEALSHVSYCAITGMRVKEQDIGKQWDDLRKLIACISPEDSCEIYPIPATLKFEFINKEST